MTMAGRLPEPYGRDGGGANLADILERVLDKGIVIAGDIRINLLDIELLTIKLRLVVASVDRAKEMGIDWWEHDPSLSSRAKGDGSGRDGRPEPDPGRDRLDGDARRDALAEENDRLRAEIERLREAAGLPAPDGAREPAAGHDGEGGR